MAHNVYQIPKEKFDVIMVRYEKYLAALNDPNMPPVTVFDPLNPKQIQELELIREVSKNLQKKKEDDVKKAAEAKLEQEKKEAEEKAAAEAAAAEAAAAEESKEE